MKNISFLLIFLICLGCEKSDLLENRNSEKFSTCNILGIVNKEKLHPVEGAVVTFNGITTRTDVNGVYLFEDVEVSSLHNKITIEKEDYYTSCRIFTSDQESILRQYTNLSKKVSSLYNPQNEFNFEFSDFGVVIPANTLATESGQILTVNGHMHLKNYSPYYFDEIPGNFVGLDVEEDHVKLNPIGIIRCEMEDSNGSKLTIREGEKIKMKLKIFSDFLNKATDQISMWLYNEETGYWQEKGSAIRIGDYYEADVSKLGLWGFHLSEKANIYSGRIVNRDGKSINAAISFAANKNYNFYGTTQFHTTGGEFTNYDGSFSFWNPIDKKLNFAFWTEGAETFKIEKDPCPNNCNLGDITLKQLISTDIKGEVMDCHNQPLQLGYVRRNTNFGIDYIIPVVKGVFFDNVVTSTVGTIVTYTPVDNDTKMNGTSIDVPISLSSQSKNIGTLLACQK